MAVVLFSYLYEKTNGQWSSFMLCCVRWPEMTVYLKFGFRFCKNALTPSFEASVHEISPAPW